MCSVYLKGQQKHKKGEENQENESKNGYVCIYELKSIERATLGMFMPCLGLDTIEDLLKS